MFTIVIGEQGEYGRRLRNYLETHWEGSLRLNSFTKPEALLTSEEKADCWLLDEDFFRILQEKQELWPDIRERCILLSDEEKEGSFCRYHPPAALVEMIKERQRTLSADGSGTGESCMVTALYSPVFEPELAAIAASCMETGGLYLGMEDIGTAVPGRGNMGDLCYFIGLQSEDILSRVRETAREEDGIWYVDSPGLYFDLLELTEGEYQWFFRSLKESGEYAEIYVGLGSGILGTLPLNALFDRFLLIDSDQHERQHTACDHLERALRSESRRFRGSFERRRQEEFLHGSIQ